MCINRQPSELAGYQQKLVKISDNIGIAIAGLTADARSLGKYMRNECVNYKFTYNEEMPVYKLVRQIAAKYQNCTQTYVRRPYGVGLLVIGYDDMGSHLYETSPSGTAFEYYSSAIGSRSQSARTYLGKLFNENDEPEFADASLDELIKHAVYALSDCTEADKAINSENISVSVVGDGVAYHELNESELQKWIDEYQSTQAAKPSGDENVEGGDDAAPIEEED